MKNDLQDFRQTKLSIVAAGFLPWVLVIFSGGPLWAQSGYDFSDSWLAIRVFDDEGLEVKADADFFPFDSPFKETTAKQSGDGQAGTGPSASIMRGPFYVWQNYLSQVDGPKCGHYPTCSHFGYIAVRRYGAAGVFYTTARLIGEAGDLSSYRFYELHIRDGRGRVYDPAEDYQSLETNKAHHSYHDFLHDHY